MIIYDSAFISLTIFNLLNNRCVEDFLTNLQPPLKYYTILDGLRCLCFVADVINILPNITHTVLCNHVFLYCIFISSKQNTVPKWATYPFLPIILPPSFPSGRAHSTRGITHNQSCHASATNRPRPAIKSVRHGSPG